MNRGMRLLKSVAAIHRRRFLRRSFGGLVGVLAASVRDAAKAQNDFKMTKKQAGYIVRQKSSTEICAQCIFFIAPNDCSIVRGPVSPQGWCKYYGD
jgi:hypothetical protein